MDKRIADYLVKVGNRDWEEFLKEKEVEFRVNTLTRFRGEIYMGSILCQKH